MKISDLFRLSYKALSERKIRAILTIVGIMIGPFALVTIGGVTRGYGDYIIKNITGLGQNIIVVTPERGFTLTYNDIERIKSIRYV
ncbi:MAG: ABC transporter permease, partial [Desulfurococcaceae archaeon]